MIVLEITACTCACKIASILLLKFISLTLTSSAIMSVILNVADLNLDAFNSLLIIPILLIVLRMSMTMNFVPNALFTFLLFHALALLACNANIMLAYLKYLVLHFVLML